jgi:putative effector of murein hydrolase
VVILILTVGVVLAFAGLALVAEGVRRGNRVHGAGQSRLFATPNAPWTWAGLLAMLLTGVLTYIALPS